MNQDYYHQDVGDRSSVPARKRETPSNGGLGASAWQWVGGVPYHPSGGYDPGLDEWYAAHRPDMVWDGSGGVAPFADFGDFSAQQLGKALGNDQTLAPGGGGVRRRRGMSPWLMAGGAAALVWFLRRRKKR